MGKGVSAMKKKILKYGGSTLAIILIVVAVLLAVNVLGYWADSSLALSADLTKENLYSITQTTKEKLAALDQDITIYTVFEGSSSNTDLDVLLSRYSAASSHIHVKNIYPKTNTDFLSKFDSSGSGIDTGSIIVANSDESLFRVISPVELYALDSQYNVTGTRAESRITNAIHYVSTGEEKRAAFLSGHSETNPQGLSSLLKILDGLNYEMGTYNLSSPQFSLNAQRDILFIIAPMQDLTDDEYTSLASFLEEGGKAVFFMDNMYADPLTGGTQIFLNHMVNFEKLFAQYQITINKDVVLNPAEVTDLSASTLLINLADHEITQPVKDLDYSVVFNNLSSLTLGESTEGITVAPFLSTADTCYQKAFSESLADFAQTDSDQVGSFTVGAVASNANGGQIVVIPSSSLATNNALSYPGNTVLMQGIIDYLANAPAATTLPAKSLEIAALKLPSTAALYGITALVLLVIPLAIFIVGMVRWRQRKKL